MTDPINPFVAARERPGQPVEVVTVDDRQALRQLAEKRRREADQLEARAGQAE
ncbi:hypothetical protein [Actinoplanes subtropicus]|uniref:hypothetical protein n=1 Tax=Actinoplanes subtropicus TaxID=543632 RepID=UPI0012F81CBB|nr:hypothetical protein [Actinoplanes subtropicus]